MKRAPCPYCEAHKRVLWLLFGPNEKPEYMVITDRGNYVLLCKCEKCGALWCNSPYEPFLSCEYLVRWEYSAADWRVAHNLNDGKTLQYWHAGAIRSNWTALSSSERETVNRHRERTYGKYNPIDNLAFGSVEMTEVLGLPLYEWCAPLPESGRETRWGCLYRRPHH